MTLLGLKTNLKCLTIFSIIMSSVARTFCNKPDDLTSTLNPAVEPSTCMSFRIPITTLIVSWSTRTVLALKGSPLLQNRGNSRVTFPKLPSLYTLYGKQIYQYKIRKVKMYQLICILYQRENENEVHVWIVFFLIFWFLIKKNIVFKYKYLKSSFNIVLENKGFTKKIKNKWSSESYIAI